MLHCAPVAALYPLDRLFDGDQEALTPVLILNPNLEEKFAMGPGSRSPVVSGREIP